MEYVEQISPIILKADKYLKELIYKVSPLYKKENGDFQDVTVPLFSTLHSTSESIMMLLLNHANYDADVLLRTVMEGTIKYCYLMTGNATERQIKYDEYKIKLVDIDKVSDHKKAAETIDILKEFSQNNTKPFECDILSEDVLSALNDKYPRKIRNEIKNKWSYQALLRSLALCFPEYKAQLGTLATYALTSHYCHYDWTGVSNRNAQIMEAINPESIKFDIAHAYRIISNVLSMALFRVAEYMRGNKCYLPEVAKLSIEIMNYASEINDLNNNFLEANAELVGL